MASPSVVNSATTDGTSADSTPTINLPGSIVSGNTLVALFRSAAGGAIGFPAGWTELVDASADGADDQMAVAWRKADGTEGSTIDLTSGNGKFAAIVWQISGATDPTITAPEISTVATGTDDAPDPSTVTPTGGSKDYLFLWLGGWEGKQTSPPSGNPTNYSGPLGASSGGPGSAASNCRVAGAHRELTAASEDPGSWTISASDDWSAYALAVHPSTPPQTRSVAAATSTADAPAVTRTPGGVTRGVSAATSTADAVATTVKNANQVVVSTASTTGDVPAAARSPGVATRSVTAADGSSDSVPLDGVSPGAVTRSVVAADATTDAPTVTASTGGAQITVITAADGLSDSVPLDGVNPGAVTRSVVVADATADAPAAGRSPGAAPRSVAAATSTTDAPTVTASTPIVGEVKGQGEAIAAVDGMGEAIAAVDGQGQVLK